MIIYMLIYIIVLVIFTFVAYTILQIKLAGMNIKDFWKFINSIKDLERLYRISKRYEKMNYQEQVIFLSESEKLFEVFDKIPNVIWENEYNKYMEILETYKNLKVLRWAENY